MAITYDNSASFTCVGSGTTSTSYTMSTGDNGYLIVNAGPLITAFTYGGVSMTKDIDFEPSIHDGNQQRVNVWVLANPPTGSNTLQATIGGSDNEQVGIVSYTGLNTSVGIEDYVTAFSNNGTNNTQVGTLATSLTPLTDNAYVVMFSRGANSGRTFTATQGTLRVSSSSILTNSQGIIDKGSPTSPISAVTLEATWSSSSGFISNVIMALRPVGVPNAPTINSVTPLLNSVQIAFSSNGDNGSPITSYTVTVTPGGATFSGSSSPILVTGLNQNVSYTFTVYATNAFGNSPNSSPSAAVTLNSAGLLSFFP